uniref:Uncharacterized protein n=1 Tax=Globodera rostochiensis TaxID=31243 RepID=A0A914I1J4_GLORO
MQIFVSILFLAIFYLCTGEKEEDPPLPPELSGADERCLVLTCTKSAAFMDEKVRKSLMQKFCPSVSPTTATHAANGWCSVEVSQLITPNLIPSGPSSAAAGINSSGNNSTNSIGAVVAIMKMFFRLADRGFWMLVYVPDCGGHMDMANNVPSIVQRRIKKTLRKNNLFMQIYTEIMNETDENATLTVLLEALWLSSTLLLCLTMIVGCACCSLQRRTVREIDVECGGHKSVKVIAATSIKPGTGVDSFVAAAESSCEIEFSGEASSLAANC